MIYTKNGQNIFRIAYELYEDADPVILQTALSEILPNYPSLNVRMRKGFFWHYFEENNKPPIIHREEKVLTGHIDIKANNFYQFRVSYFNRTVSFDYEHSVTDGKGGTEFSKAVMLRYFELKGYPVSGEGIIRPTDSPSSAEELEDGFAVYAKPITMKEIGLKDSFNRSGCRITGVPLDETRIGLINGIASAAAIKALAKQYQATVTEYLGGIYLYSIYKTNYRKTAANLPIKLMFPVNLRRLFPSKTLRNFTLTSVATLDVGSEEISLKDCIECCKEGLKPAADKEHLQRKISGIDKAFKNPFIMLMPLPLKSLMFFVIQRALARIKNNTTILTNPGVTTIPESMTPYIKHMFMALLPIRGYNRLLAGLITYGDKLSFTFARRFKDTELIRFFFKQLTDEGIELTISSNYAELGD
jgi:hypothetical protein